MTQNPKLPEPFEFTKFQSYFEQSDVKSFQQQQPQQQLQQQQQEKEEDKINNDLIDRLFRHDNNHSIHEDSDIDNDNDNDNDNDHEPNDNYTSEYSRATADSPNIDSSSLFDSLNFVSSNLDASTYSDSPYMAGPFHMRRITADPTLVTIEKDSDDEKEKEKEESVSMTPIADSVITTTTTTTMAATDANKNNKGLSDGGRTIHPSRKPPPPHPPPARPMRRFSESQSSGNLLSRLRRKDKPKDDNSNKDQDKDINKNIDSDKDKDKDKEKNTAIDKENKEKPQEVPSLTKRRSVIESNRERVLERLSKANTKKELLSQLESSMARIEAKIKAYINEMAKLQNERKQIKETMNSEMKEWEKRAAWECGHVCQSYHENHELFLKVKSELCAANVECFQHKYKEMKRVLDRLRIHEKSSSKEDILLSIEAAIMTASNIRLPRSIMELRTQEKTLSLVVKELKQRYEEKKWDVMKPMTAQDRSVRLLTLLIQITDGNKDNQSDGLPYFHPIDNGFQTPFEQLLLDPRFEEGRIISKWKDLKKKNKDISMRNIARFSQHLTETLLKNGEITSDKSYFQSQFFDATHLMICRCIFPRSKAFMNGIIAKDSNEDRQYLKRLTWMAGLSQEQIGIDKEFRHKHCEQAYLDAIAQIRRIDIRVTQVPQDSIMILIEAIHCIQKTATDYHRINCSENGKVEPAIINGDVLFPIVVFCVLRSGVHTWHAWTHCMEQFFRKDILQFGQSGFCFTLLKATVLYVMARKPSSFGLDDNIE